MLNNKEVTIRENTEIIKQGIEIKSIINDYSKLREWELKILVEKGYEEAILEQKKRDLLSQSVRTR